mmetsp:Transcript_54180/g.129033  ORF Transcript_54180/g.129033 Transcript_54180/m.129033 type:complete len:211 (+) Transcript_54180:1738-2370(+)
MLTACQCCELPRPSVARQGHAKHRASPPQRQNGPSPSSWPEPLQAGNCPVGQDHRLQPLSAPCRKEAVLQPRFLQSSGHQSSVCSALAPAAPAALSLPGHPPLLQVLRNPLPEPLLQTRLHQGHLLLLASHLHLRHRRRQSFAHRWSLWPLRLRRWPSHPSEQEVWRGSSTKQQEQCRRKQKLDSSQFDVVSRYRELKRRLRPSYLSIYK